MVVANKAELIAEQLLSANINKKIWDSILYNVKTYGAKGDGITDDTTAMNKAIAETPEGGTLYFPRGIYLINSNLLITKSIHLWGEKPFWDGTKLVNGSIIKDAGIIVTSGSNISFEGIGVDTPNTANGFELLGTGISNVRFTECVSTARDHCYLMQSYSGIVKDVIVTRCEARKSTHGFISKAELVQFTDCVATDCNANGFGIISDNIMGTTLGQALSNKLSNCHAENCAVGLTFYARDTKSSTNANGVKNSNHSVSNFGAKDCTVAGITIGDSPTAAPAGQIYLPPSDLTITGHSHNSAAGYSIVIEQCVNVTLQSVTSNRGMSIATTLCSNLVIDGPTSILSKLASYFDFTNLPSGTTPSVATGTGLFKTNNNGTITNLLDGKENRIITIVFMDDNTTISSGPNFNLYRGSYSGIGSSVTLKNQDGKWFEVHGQKVSRGALQRGLVADATPLPLQNGSVWDIMGTGSTANVIDFAGKNLDSEVITLIIRSTNLDFTYGGFNAANFVVPSAFPKTANFGTAIMSQWVFMTAIGKWVCVNQSTAPYV